MQTKTLGETLQVTWINADAYAFALVPGSTVNKGRYPLNVIIDDDTANPLRVDSPSFFPAPQVPFNTITIDAKEGGGAPGDKWTLQVARSAEAVPAERTLRDPRGVAVVREAGSIERAHVDLHAALNLAALDTIGYGLVFLHPDGRTLVPANGGPLNLDMMWDLRDARALRVALHSAELFHTAAANHPGATADLSRVKLQVEMFTARPKLGDEAHLVIGAGTVNEWGNSRVATGPFPGMIDLGHHIQAVSQTDLETRGYHMPSWALIYLLKTKGAQLRSSYKAPDTTEQPMASRLTVETF